MSTTTTVERRYIPAQELRVSDGAGAPKIRGYAALFRTRSENLGGFVEVIAPGAFKGAIPRSDIRALWNHDPNYVLGRMKAGTLSVAEDDRGLAIENTPPDAQWARDLLVSMRRGDVDQMSFGFTVSRGGSAWEDQPDGTVLRTITEVQELFDVSPVTYPAYPDTSVAVRSLAAWMEGRAAGGDGDWRARLDTLYRKHRQALAR